MPKKIDEEKNEEVKEIKRKTTSKTKKAVDEKDITTAKKTDAKKTTKTTTKKTSTTTKKKDDKDIKQENEVKTSDKKIKKAKSTKGKKNIESRSLEAESLIKIVEPAENAVEEKKEIVIRQDELEEIEKTIKKERVFPKGIEQESNKKVFTNLLIACIIMLFFIFLMLGQKNITTSEYVVDIKVFAVSFLFFAIVLFEKGYKKDSGTLAIHGIELLVLGFVTMLLVNVVKLDLDAFVYIAILNVISYLFAIYYCIKSIVLYKRLKTKMQDKKSAEIRKTMKK